MKKHEQSTNSEFVFTHDGSNENKKFIDAVREWNGPLERATVNDKAGRKVPIEVHVSEQMDKIAAFADRPISIEMAVAMHQESEEMYDFLWNDFWPRISNGQQKKLLKRLVENCFAFQSEQLNEMLDFWRLEPIAKELINEDSWFRAEIVKLATSGAGNRFKAGKMTQAERYCLIDVLMQCDGVMILHKISAMQSLIRGYPLDQELIKGVALKHHGDSWMDVLREGLMQAFRGQYLNSAGLEISKQYWIGELFSKDEFNELMEPRVKSGLLSLYGFKELAPLITQLIQVGKVNKKILIDGLALVAPQADSTGASVEAVRQALAEVTSSFEAAMLKQERIGIGIKKSAIAL